MTALSNRELSHLAMPAAWKGPLALAALAYGWVLLLYGATAWSMAATWARSETFAHGFLVLPIVLWLAWRKRESLAEETPSPSRLAAWGLLPVGLLWFLGELADANALAQGALVALLAGMVPALLGWKVARKLAFPLAFLAFAVPLGEFLIPVLMDWTARFTVLGLRLSGVPVYQEGLEFVIPTGNWSVVEACSGIRYLIASLMVGTLFAYLNFRSLQRRLAFVAVSALVPIAANWVRAYGVVMIGHLSGNRLATGVDHLVYGWLFFGVVVLLLFLIGARWSDLPAPGHAGLPMGQAAGRPAGVRPLDWGAAGRVALAAALPVLALALVDRANAAGAPALPKDPAAFEALGWKAADGAAPAWRPAFRDAADTWHQEFRKDGRTVGLHIGYYRNQDRDHKLAAGTGEQRPRAGSPQPATARWYWAAGVATDSLAGARARIAGARLLGEGDDAAVVVLSAPAGGEAAIEDFRRSTWPAVTELLNDTRNRR